MQGHRHWALDKPQADDCPLGGRHLRSLVLPLLPLAPAGEIVLGLGQFSLQVRFMGQMICPRVGKKGGGVYVPRAGTADSSCLQLVRSTPERCAMGSKTFQRESSGGGWAACQRSLLREHPATVLQTCALTRPRPQRHPPTALSTAGLWGPRLDVRHSYRTGWDTELSIFKGLPVPFLKASCVCGPGPGKSATKDPTTFNPGTPETQTAKPTWRQTLTAPPCTPRPAR